MRDVCCHCADQHCEERTRWCGLLDQHQCDRQHEIATRTTERVAQVWPYRRQRSTRDREAQRHVGALRERPDEPVDDDPQHCSDHSTDRGVCQRTQAAGHSSSDEHEHDPDRQHDDSELPHDLEETRSTPDSLQ